MRATTFRTVGIGYALSNLGLKETILEIFLPEQSNMRNGELSPGSSNLKYDIKDINNMQRTGKIETSNTIKATWLPMDARVALAPSIRRGERVEVLATGDDDTYYWRELGLDAHLRRLDTFIFAISNTTDETTTEMTGENTYWIEFSTHSKKFAIVTGKSDNEAFAHQFFIDAANSIMKMMDDKGNFSEINSHENRIVSMNADNSYLSIDKKTITASIFEGPEAVLDEENITAVNKAGSRLSLVGPLVSIESSEGGKFSVDKNISMTDADGGTVTISGGNLSLKSSSGGSMDVDDSVGVSGATVDIAGDSAVNVDGGGGKLVASGGMVMSN